jgi:osmotically-inducible protein OsmY
MSSIKTALEIEKDFIMNTINRVSSSLSILLSILLMLTVSACNAAKTSSDAPNTTDTNGKVSSSKNDKATQDDAQSKIRRNQLNADIQAREQRNNMGGGELTKRADGDLSSEVRSKLEANIPLGKLTIASKNAVVTVSGVVKKQNDLDKIRPLAMEIKGVQSVIVKAVVSP